MQPIAITSFNIFLLNMNFDKSIIRLRVHLDWAFCSICTFSVFLVDPMGTVHVQSNSTKHKILGKFRSHSTIHTFKNCFATVFLVISFQFSANKWYPSTLYFLLISFMLTTFFKRSKINNYVINQVFKFQGFVIQNYV